MDSVIALVALLVSVVSVGVSIHSNVTAQRALRSAREEFNRSGPVLEIRTVYRFKGPDVFSGIELRVANNGRTPTTITDVGFEDSEGRGISENHDDRLEPGEVAVYWYALEDLNVQGFNYDTLEPVVESGHGYFYGGRLERTYSSEIRAYYEALSKRRVSKPLAVDPGNAPARRRQRRSD